MRRHKWVELVMLPLTERCVRCGLKRQRYGYTLSTVRWRYHRGSEVPGNRAGDCEITPDEAARAMRPKESL